MPLENILWLAGIPIAFIGLMFLIHYSFVPGTKKKLLRHLIFITRFLTISLLLVGLAAPYSATTRVEQGDTTVNVLIDESKSMDAFDFNKDALLAKLGGLDGVNVIPIGEEFSSPIGNAILNSLLGKDNILLVSDGNVNSGKDLGEVLSFAASLNSTVNVINLKEEKDDASIFLLGGKKIVANVPSIMYVEVDEVGNRPYTATIRVDGVQVHQFSDNKARREEITLNLAQGFHRIEASIDGSDFRADNNKFTKVVEAIKQPRVLLVTSSSSPMQSLLTKGYDVDIQQTIPQSLTQYFAVVLQDVPAGQIEPSIGALTSYVADGNGLVVVGGDSSYDLGGYESSQIESLLPAKVGAAIPENITDLNVVMVIDISVSSGLTTEGGSVVDIQKAQAIKVFNQLNPEDYVGVVAFNNEAHEVSPLKKVKLQTSIPNRISQLTNSGGTYMETGLVAAGGMLEYAPGNKQLIIFSDGKTKNREYVLNLAKEYRKKGIAIHTIGVGPGSDTEFLTQVAIAGGGTYFRAGSESQLALVIGDQRADSSATKGIKFINQDHFITKNLQSNAEIAGYNQVVPKPSAQLLAGTEAGIPLLMSWRFGLGRVVVLATDGGEKWAPQLYAGENGKILARSLNWAIGDPRRKISTRVYIDDGYLYENLEVRIISETRPSLSDVTLTEIDNDIYAGTLRPNEEGTFEISGEKFAVNYPREYQYVSKNPSLDELVRITNGEILDETDDIAQKIQEDSQKVIEDREYYRMYIIGGAIILFLIDTFLRRMFKKSKDIKTTLTEGSL